MSKADQFRQYAEEDVRWARRSTIDKEKSAARTSPQLDASGVTEREHCSRQRQSARAQGCLSRFVTPARISWL
jgi:hypothetical protein